MRTIKLIRAAALAAGLSAAALAAANDDDVLVLDFEGLGDQETVLEYYNGGSGGNGSGPGPDFDISFSPNALSLIDSDAGGSGNIGGEPSPDTVLFFLEGTETTLNAPNGFDDGFSFFYSAPFFPGDIQVYSGLNATGDVLATLDLPLTPDSGVPDDAGNFAPLVPLGVAFNGVARSIDFGGTANFIVFDNITVGSDVPVPEPTLGLLAAGAGTLLLRRRAR